MDAYRVADLFQPGHHLGVEVGHRAGRERHAPLAAVGAPDQEAMRVEVELELEVAQRPCGMSEVVSPRADRYRGTCHEWLTRGASVSLTLSTICGPHVEGRAGRLSGRERERRPGGGVVRRRRAHLPSRAMGRSPVRMPGAGTGVTLRRRGARVGAALDPPSTRTAFRPCMTSSASG